MHRILDLRETTSYNMRLLQVFKLRPTPSEGEKDSSNCFPP